MEGHSLRHGGLGSAWNTALILEDDVDWDKGLRNQMHMVWDVLAAANLDWDVLWLGHQGDHIPADAAVNLDMRDPSVPSSDARTPWLNDTSMFPEGIRKIHDSDFPLGTFAYAVTSSGAAKILHRMHRRLIGNFDNELANHCRTGLRCLTVTPALIGEAWAAKSDSDNVDGGKVFRDRKYYVVFFNINLLEDTASVAKANADSIRTRLEDQEQAEMRSGRGCLVEKSFSHKFLIAHGRVPELRNDHILGKG
ncbi:Hypothetical protein D9617_15g042140 [Elsinoe fawcettii]|nr:Hypothetical protein D9617_15g042140 [Elsinoe fawcettii]